MEEADSLETLEAIKEEISRFQSQYEELINEQKDLAKCRDDQQHMAKEFRDRYINTINAMHLDEIQHTKDIQFEMERLDTLRMQNTQLSRDVEKAVMALKEQGAKNMELIKMTDVISAVPEREVVFRGGTGDIPSTTKYDVKSRVMYPMEGGTALITFEEEIVAQKILALQHHKVSLEEDCYVTVEARPILLVEPTTVEMDTIVCPRSILVSNLPHMNRDSLLDKLEIHFSKPHNGGGEVMERHIQEDSGNVVIVFKHDNFAKGLTDTEHHVVQLQKKKTHKVRVTPFINGVITNLETKSLVCSHSVLLTGIPAVMDADSLQDMLEIHFQKGSNGGGEITAILYNPVGQNTVAIFEA